MDVEKTGRFIAARRRELGLSQQELAERLHVTNKAVSKWETGRSLPDGATLAPLAEALGVTADELLAGEKSGGQKNKAEPRPVRTVPPEGWPEPGKKPMTVWQARAKGAEQENRRWVGRIMQWTGWLILLAQAIFLFRREYIYPLGDWTTLSAVPAEQWQITRLPGLVICAAGEARAVILRGLLGYWVSVPAAGLLTLGAAALIIGGTVKKRRAEREARERL